MADGPDIIHVSLIVFIGILSIFSAFLFLSIEDKNRRAQVDKSTEPVEKKQEAREVGESTEVDSLTKDMNPPQFQAFEFKVQEAQEVQEVQENREDVKARGWSPTKKIHIAFFLSLPGVVFGLCAWIAFILAIVAMRKLEPSEKTSTTIGLLVGALVLGGIFGPFKGIGNLLIRLGVV